MPEVESKLVCCGSSMTHVVEEDAELWVGLWVDCGLEDGEENILQHLAKMGHKVPASEDVTKLKRDEKKTKFS